MPFSNLISLYNAFIQVWDKNKAHWKRILGGQTTLCQSGTGDILLPSLSSVIYPGRVLPLCWVIWMCRRFDPLFWHSEDWNRSFGGIFFSSTNTKTIFWGIKTTNSYRIRSFRPQISFFPRSFWVQFSAASGTPPSVFGPSTPPGVIYIPAPDCHWVVYATLYFPTTMFCCISYQMTTVLSITGGADVPCGIRILGCIDGARMLNCGRCE